jgi:hypothetical protein
MALAGMLALDQDALICDMAETYHVLDMWALPVPLLATLASGLRDDSRIRLKRSEMLDVSTQTLLATIADEIALLAYGLSGGEEKPVLVTDLIQQKEPENSQKQKLAAFESGEAFREEWKRRTKGGN